MDGFRLIVVPYELGRLRDGVGRGPEQLLEAGAERALAACGANVRTEVVELDHAERTGEGDEDIGFELIREVAARVGAAVEAGAFPVVLSGSCFAGVGVVAGLGEATPGVVWLDAHADYNNTETAISGYFDGMGVAVLTGEAWQGLLAGVPGARPLPEEAVVHAGARDFDPPEERRLAASAIRRVTAEELREPTTVSRAVAAITPPVSGVYLHVDLDVLDLAVARVNVFGAPGGIDGAELESVVAEVCSSSPVRAVSLTAYDPSFDVAEHVPPIALALLRRVGEAVAAQGC